MKKIKDEELKTIEGGGINIGAFALISAGVAFIIGIFDGIVRPLKCR